MKSPCLLRATEGGLRIAGDRDVGRQAILCRCRRKGDGRGIERRKCCVIASRFLKAGQERIGTAVSPCGEGDYVGSLAYRADLATCTYLPNSIRTGDARHCNFRGVRRAIVGKANRRARSEFRGVEPGPPFRAARTGTGTSGPPPEELAGLLHPRASALTTMSVALSLRNA